MKKVLLALVAIIVIAGLLGGKMMYDKMQQKKAIEELSKFEMPPDFATLLSKENLKKVKAPIYDFRMQGERIIPDMLEVIKATSNTEATRCAAMIVVAHLAKAEAIDTMIEMLKAPEGRLSECASVFLQLFYQASVAEKIRGVAKEKSLDRALRVNAFNAMYWWASRDLKKQEDKLKRMKNPDLKKLALAGIEEEDMEIRKISIDMLRYVSFKMEAEEGKKAELNKVIEKVLPYIENEDTELADKTFNALMYLIGNMAHAMDMLGKVKAYAASKKPKAVRLRGAKLIRMIYDFEVSDLRKETEDMYFLLDDSEKEVLLEGIKVMEKHGRSADDRVALKPLTESKDEEIAEAAKKAQAAITKAEKE